MRLEFVVPVLFGILLCLLGLGLVFDAWTEDDRWISRERRRHPRIERDRNGEGLVGLGVLCMGAAFIGRDTWSLRTIAVIVGFVLLAWGSWKNKHFLGAWTKNRGALRRRHEDPVTHQLPDLPPPAAPDENPPPKSDEAPRLRIR